MLGAAIASALVWVLAPGIGSADTPGLTASVPPYDYTGFQSHLILNDVGPAGGLPANHVPSSFSMSFAQGFGFDPQAVSTTCSTAQADPNNNTCPPASRIGRGTIDVTISGLISGTDQAQITVFQMPPQAPGDIAGVAFYFSINDTKNQFMFQGTSIGHLRSVSGDPQFGSTIAFDKLQFPTIPPGINITLNDMKLDLGAPDLSAAIFASSSTPGTTPVKRHHRKHKKHKKHKKHARHPSKKTHGRRATAGQAKLIPKPVAHSLLTNPASCSGTWPIRVSWGYSDGTRSADAAAACAAAPSS
jgi:hypothetical protein